MCVLYEAFLAIQQHLRPRLPILSYSYSRLVQTPALAGKVGLSSPYLDTTEIEVKDTALTVFDRICADVLTHDTPARPPVLFALQGFER